MCGYLERLHEGPEQDAYGLALSQQLDQASCSEEPEKTQVDEVVLKNREYGRESKEEKHGDGDRKKRSRKRKRAEPMLAGRLTPPSLSNNNPKHSKGTDSRGS